MSIISTISTKKQLKHHKILVKSRARSRKNRKNNCVGVLSWCNNGLSKLKEIFNQNRTKTNTKRITLPYFNSILHGRGLNYANAYVSCTRVALMFAIVDWMKMKNSEQARKAAYEKYLNPPSIRESLSRLMENQKLEEEISSWRKRDIYVGNDIPVSGTAKDYVEYSYIVKLVEMLDT